jgi:hypothetical protein
MPEQQQQENQVQELMEEMQVGLRAGEARVNITYGGQNADLPDPVLFDAADADVRRWAEEAVRSGTLPGVPQAATASFTDFVIDRFPATETRPYPLIQVRPKTPFG